jgi:TIR domain
MSGIFISYRREDSAPYAGRLYDRLCTHFGADQVFMDVDDIPPGADFAAHIDAKVGSCDAMVVVIGKDWLTARNADGQLRLSDPSDFVGLEVSLALQRSVLVIPVLVGGAQVPKPEELRADLKALSKRNALTLNDPDFQRDVDQLIAALDKAPGLRKPALKQNIDSRAELRKKLLRRLVWKVPLIFLLMSLAVWWQVRRENEAQLTTATQTGASKATAFTGSWKGDVTYPWQVSHTEQFFFQPEGDKLFGTATFLGVKHGIEDGKIVGETISFSVAFEEIYGSTMRSRRNRYEGKLTGDTIRLRIMDDQGNSPVELILTRSPSKTP